MEQKLSIGLPTFPAIHEPLTPYLYISPSGSALSLFSESRLLKMKAICSFETNGGDYSVM
jgi:hypothetical protein